MNALMIYLMLISIDNPHIIYKGNNFATGSFVSDLGKFQVFGIFFSCLHLENKRENYSTLFCCVVLL